MKQDSQNGMKHVSVNTDQIAVFVIINYENYKCRKKLVDKLAEECTQTVKEVKLAKITSAEDENKHKYSSCTLYVVLILLLFTINVGIGSYFLYFYWYSKKDVTRVRFGTRTQTKI